jgi:hypothetical protein
MGAKILIEKLKEYSPLLVCFNGMGIFEVISTNFPQIFQACTEKKCKVGLQPKGSISQLEMPLFVIPSSR